MEFTSHKLCLRGILSNAFKIRVPHITGYCLNLLVDSRAYFLKKLIQCFFFLPLPTYTT
jgi:hypothetical protein